MVSGKEISRAWAFGRTILMREVGRGRKRTSSSKTHDSSLGQSSRNPQRLGAIRLRKLG